VLTPNFGLTGFLQNFRLKFCQPAELQEKIEKFCERFFTIFFLESEFFTGPGSQVEKKLFGGHR
jgi:hypothetical protein